MEASLVEFIEMTLRAIDLSSPAPPAMKDEKRQEIEFEISF